MFPSSLMSSYIGSREEEVTIEKEQLKLQCIFVLICFDFAAFNLKAKRSFSFAHLIKDDIFVPKLMGIFAEEVIRETMVFGVSGIQKPFWTEVNNKII